MPHCQEQEVVNSPPLEGAGGGQEGQGWSKIELTAVGQSEAGIQFYSWDFNYNAEKGFKADVMIDKEGKQTVKLKSGIHHIAVKTVDNDGLESIETITIDN
jgi:hypothetical protein